MTDQSGTGTDHTLFIIETDDLHDPDLYQVTLLEHPRSSPQAKVVHKAHREVAKNAREETGERHRVVVEEHSPEEAKRLYELHQGRTEETLMTDGGTDTGDTEREEPCAKCGQPVKGDWDDDFPMPLCYGCSQAQVGLGGDSDE